MKLLLAALVIQLASNYPVQRVGPCPDGYYGSGDYCVPDGRDAGKAIIKRGSCPDGYTSEDQYCVEDR